MSSQSEAKKTLAHRSWIAIAVIVILVILGAVLAINSIYSNQKGNATTSVTGSETIKGILSGYVTVGPSSPVCKVGQSCNVNMTGYSLEFSLQCPSVTPSMTSTPCGMSYYAQLSPSGHYSILLSPGNYEMTGLVPTCNWVGCYGAFPQSVQVSPGQQKVVNVYIENGA